MTVDVFAVSEGGMRKFVAEVFRGFRRRGLVVIIQLLLWVFCLDPVCWVLVGALTFIWVFIIAVASILAPWLLIVIIIIIIIKLVFSPATFICLGFHWLLLFGLSKTEKTTLSTLLPNVGTQLRDHRTRGRGEFQEIIFTQIHESISGDAVLYNHSVTAMKS